MREPLRCFKAYDIRGKLIEQLDEDIAFRIGLALVETLGAKIVVVGSDARLTSEPLKLALSAGIISAGAQVLDIGMVGTEEIYFATQYLEVDAGVEVTASHNPIDYNGMKIVKAGSVPISGDSGLNEIKLKAQDFADEMVLSGLSQFGGFSQFNPETFLAGVGRVQKSKLTASEAYKEICTRSEYVKHVCSYIDVTALNGRTFVVNSGNGSAGPVMDAIESYLHDRDIDVSFIKVHHQPDGMFPNGIPNPLLPENRSDTADEVLRTKADMGIAWDGDFDRCFLFDEQGRFVEGYYIVGLLAQAFLNKHPQAKIIYDPRVYWNTEAIIGDGGGIPVKSKTGHAFIKERMRAEDAVYGGEMSAHHYFRDFAYCDSGMIPWLLVAELLATRNEALSNMVDDRIAAYPSSGEINSKVADADSTLAKIVAHYQSHADIVDDTDGVGLEFGNWRFNLRKSNTEPVIRLNVESKGDVGLMQQKTKELLAMIRS